MKKLHVVFKTHLDIGFTDQSEAVIQQYMEDFIPRAVKISQEYPDFIWTTGSWLIDYFLNNEQISENERAAVIQAIEAGNICWHGLPFTTHTELMDEKLFVYGLSISQKLDKRFNRKTISAKMTDVPGHTIGIVPKLKQVGIKYFHIGVNPSSAVPEVPEIFLWQAGDGSEVIVHYDGSYGGDFVKEDWEEGLYFAHSNDNYGPPRDANEVKEILSELQKKYPGTEIVISTLDNFAQYVWKKKASLPVISDEIGDSWIHGGVSDPDKMAKFKLLLDLRNNWLEEGSMKLNSKEYTDFSGELLLIPEHTWGVNANLYLPDYNNYLIEDFKQARSKSIFDFKESFESLTYSQLMTSINMYVRNGEANERASYVEYENSWLEQRRYLDKAIAHLSQMHRQEVQQAFSEMYLPMISQADLFKERLTIGKIYQFGDFEVAFGASGAIEKLNLKGKCLLALNHKLGELSYEAYDAIDFQKYLNQYSRINEDTGSWVFVDFAKRGIEAIPEIQHRWLKPYCEAATIKKDNNQVAVHMSLSFEEGPSAFHGLPQKITLQYLFNLTRNELTLQLLAKEKKRNRMPESYWLETSLNVANPYNWKMSKLGQSLSPYHVISRGNREMHALDQTALHYSSADGNYQMISKYTPLLSFGERKLLNFDNQCSSLNDGLFINLYNNVWGTNFPAWYEGNLLAEVTFKLAPIKTFGC
ncbi:DUF5054 domain-containing protein [Enterococcus sp. JM9B]|uniref:DUF5054 domain-containing protein n=1 Tax=Enterococcus sp. JM9B TaxID=1857216 RepID=UPI001374B9EC|nr:DUF5054 domain-containing protein [Enterococcus sp. JM9B]KAF1300885.1 hypothetical protein BAU16_10920 [Enterococcus sp. JM9B]